MLGKNQHLRSRPTETSSGGSAVAGAASANDKQQEVPAQQITE